MALWPQFLGPAYRARSQAIAADTLINLYLEVTENSADAKQSTYYGTPGLKLLLTVGTQSCRGCFSQDNRTFVVVGNTLYELNLTTLVATNRGLIANDGKPVAFATNGRGGEQLAIVGGGQLKIFTLTTNVLSAAIALPLTNAPVTIDFMDGYFLLLEANTIRIWFSGLENGLTWNALDFFSVSQTSDNNVGLKVVRGRIYVFGSQNSGIFYDSGNATTPFVPYPGSIMLEGAVSPWAIAVLGETVYWLAQDNQGRNRMVSTTAASPTEISTPPISFALASYTTIDDAEALAYEQEGHPFVVWTFPTGDQSWAYDAREQQWHQRDNWDQASGSSHRWRARGLCATSTLLLTGDYATGALYALDLDTFQDNGAMIRRARRAPYLSAENQFIFFRRFELGIQEGVGLTSGQGSNPQLILSVSRDGAQTWTPPVTATMGAQGQYTNRAVWRNLGRARADRFVVEVTVTDPVRIVIGPGAWLEAAAGTGEL